MRFLWLLAFCLRWASNTPLKDYCRNSGLVVFDGFIMNVRPSSLSRRQVPLSPKRRKWIHCST